MITRNYSARSGSMVCFGLAGELCLALTLIGGCGDILTSDTAPLFATPLTVNGEPVGPAIIDTGGAYEVLLRDRFGLSVVGKAEVLAFGGFEVVDVTEGFSYSAGGWEATVPGALVGLSACDCNGLGFIFFRKTGAVLELDFREPRSAFLNMVPSGGVTIPFASPPPSLPAFDSAFIEVEVAFGGESRKVPGLLDTGTNASVMRRGLVGNPSGTQPGRLDVTVTNRYLGTVAVQVGLFDTGGLPDIILGTDVMGVWADRWYFHFTPVGGEVTFFPRDETGATGGPVSALPQ